MNGFICLYHGQAKTKIYMGCNPLILLGLKFNERIFNKCKNNINQGCHASVPPLCSRNFALNGTIWQFFEIFGTNWRYIHVKNVNKIFY